MAHVKSALKIHLFDVGQGEAIIIDYPDNRFSVIDGGPHVDGSPLVSEVGARLGAGKTFEFVAISQWDKDHIAGIPALLAQYKPHRFLVPSSVSILFERLASKKSKRPMPSIAEDVYQLARSFKSSLNYVRAGDRLDFAPGVEIYAIAPGNRLDDEVLDEADERDWAHLPRRFRNRASLAVWIHAWRRSLFIAGEVEEDQYREMQAHFRSRHTHLYQYLNSYRSSWLKLSHHGARDNNPSELFKLFARKPFYASSSAGGRYGHPHPISLSLVRSAGGAAMCTNLGEGCSLIQNSKTGLDPLTPESWYAVPNSIGKVPCYGDICVTVLSDGSMLLEGAAIQKRCPYGGPKQSVVSIP